MRLVHILDCVDPQPLAEFWSAALGFRVGAWEPPYQRIVDPAGRWPDLIFQAVPEAKRGKNRMHLDIQLVDMREELRRLLALGAHLVEAPHDDGGYEIATLADPQGNEFCLVVPPAGSYDHDHLMAAEAGLPLGVR